MEKAIAKTKSEIIKTLKRIQSFTDTPIKELEKCDTNSLSPDDITIFVSRVLSNIIGDYTLLLSDKCCPYCYIYDDCEKCEYGDICDVVTIIIPELLGITSTSMLMIGVKDKETCKIYGTR